MHAFKTKDLQMQTCKRCDHANSQLRNQYQSTVAHVNALLPLWPTRCWHAASEMQELGKLQSPLPFEKITALPGPGKPTALGNVVKSRTTQAKQSKADSIAMIQATKGYQAAESQGRRSSLLLLGTR